MSGRVLPVVSDIDQLSAFAAACETCVAKEECGGSVSAPCRCVRGGRKRYKCASCNINCVERLVRSTIPEKQDSYIRQFDSGLALEHIRLDPRTFSMPRLPLVIPAHTDEYGIPLRISWGSVSLSQFPMLANRDGPLAPSALRRQLLLPSGAHLLATITGLDGRLERLWASDWNALFANLRFSRIRLLTGPTFSVTRDVPASHNTTMLRRHHRILDSASAAGFAIAPNIYWQNRRDIKRWAAWLATVPVAAVSRDFSRTKGSRAFHEHLTDFLRVIDGAARPLHVILIGIGAKRTKEVIETLAQHGATCTLVAKQPVRLARARREYGFTRANEHRPSAVVPNGTVASIAHRNLWKLDAFARRVASDLPLYKSSPPPRLFSTPRSWRSSSRRLVA